jgi:hypothetical protein
LTRTSSSARSPLGRGEFAQLGAELAGVGMVELIQDGHGALPGVTGGMGIGDYGRAAPYRSVDLATLVRL